MTFSATKTRSWKKRNEEGERRLSIERHGGIKTEGRERRKTEGKREGKRLANGAATRSQSVNEKF